MSKPAAGNYYIVDRVLAPNSNQVLALTNNGVNNYATVTVFNSSASQLWSIIDYDANTQSVSPANDHSIQIGWGGSGTIVLPNGAYVWTIRVNADGTSIRDGGNTVYWGLSTATVNEIVGIGGGVTPNFGQRWYLVKA